MPYTYPIDAQAMFEDRTHQFVGFGLPADDVARVRAATNDFWTNEPGGWVRAGGRHPGLRGPLRGHGRVDPRDRSLRHVEGRRGDAEADRLAAGPARHPDRPTDGSR